MSFSDWMIPLATLGLGGWAGWWLQRRSLRSERRTMDELYTRKVRLAESDADKAIQGYNRAQAELRGLEGRSSELAIEIEGREHDLRRSHEEAAELRERLNRSEASFEGLRQELEELRAGAERARLVEEGREAELEIERQRQAAEQAELERERAHARSQRERLESELARVRTELNGHVERLEELPRVQQALTEKEAALEEREQRRAALQERLTALEGLPGRVRELELELERAAREAEEREVFAERELETRRSEFQSRLDASEACGVELQRSLAALGEELVGRERSLEDLRVRHEASERLGAERVRELERSQKREHLLEERLDKERERVDAGARALAEQQQSEDAARREIQDLKTQLATLSSSHKTLQLKGDRLAKQVADLETALDEARGNLKVARDEVRDRTIEIRGLEKDVARATRSAEEEKKRLVLLQQKQAKKEAARVNSKNSRPRARR